MSTRDLDAAGLTTPPLGSPSAPGLAPPPGSPWDALAALSAGAPDPALIGRLANELFGGWTNAPAAPAAHPGTPPAPAAGLPDAAPSTSSFQPSAAPTPTTGAPPPASAIPAPPGAPALPSAPPAPAPVGPTLASPSVMPSDAELRLVPIGHVGAAAFIPPLSAAPSPPSSPPQAPGLPLDLPVGGVGTPPTSPSPAGPVALPGLTSPSVMPSADQLSAVPRGHPAGGIPALFAPAGEAPGTGTGPSATTPPGLGIAAPSAPSAPPAPGAVPTPAAPGEGNYFLDEGQAASTMGAPPASSRPPAAAPAAEPRPFAIESLELPPGSVTADRRIPDLGFAIRPFDPRAVRRDFPILSERVHGKPLIWLDNAATTQKPNAVIDRLSEFYRRENSNIHRAAHALAARATDAYEAAREKVRRFLNAGATREIVFVRGTTEAINLVAQSWGRRHVGEGDEIVVSHLEHHANIVPWQMLCKEKGARLRVAPVNDRGELLLEEYERLLGPRTKLVAVTQVSNALGTIVPVHQVTEMAHRHGARVLVDGAQSVSHMPVDVQSIGCDWFVFSGHKVFGPTGIGAAYGRSDALDESPPWQGGGNMIADVTFEKTVYQPAPFKFEAGTGNIADAVGLGAALDYVLSLGRENIARYEHELLGYLTQGLLTVPGLRLVGTAAEKAGVASFVLDGYRTEDVGAALDREGIAVRSGHHCAQPILRRMGLEGTVRPSLAPYNTCEDVDALVAALHRLQVGRGQRPT